MEQHPIPQQVTSYEFKLVGDMTLKQFLKAATGIVLALLINSSGLVFFIKYPLIFLFGAGGLALAFVPFQDRPLETWVMAFFRSIYSPTIYTYRKKNNINWLDIDLTKKIETEEDKEEKNRPLMTKKSSEKVKEFVASLPKIKIDETDSVEKKEVKGNIIKEEIKISEPVVEKVAMGKPETKKEKAPEAEDDWRDDATGLNLTKDTHVATGRAVYGDVPLPIAPKDPNVIIGMATDTDGKIIEGAIVEIEDVNGNPIRVLKTNSLGQFKTSTQVASGKYIIAIKKDNYQFDSIEVELKGEIVQPLNIVAK